VNDRARHRHLPVGPLALRAHYGVIIIIIIIISMFIVLVVISFAFVRFRVLN